MVFRVLGIGLLIIIGIPLAIAFPPLTLVAVGAWFLASRRRPDVVTAPVMRPGLAWGPGSGWHATELSNHTRLPTAYQPPRPRRGDLGGVFLFLTGVVVFVAVFGVVARQAPFVLVPLVVLGVMFALKRAAQRVSRRLQPVIDPPPLPNEESLLALSDAAFEQRIADLLRSLHYHGIQHIGLPGRQGIDLIARDQHGHLFLVQCQQYAPGNKAGSADMQDLVDAVIRERAAGGIFVTTATFTQAAINLAQYSRVPIVLYDGAALARLSARSPRAWPAA